MFTDSAYIPPIFHSFSAYFPPNLAPIFCRSCLAGSYICHNELSYQPKSEMIWWWDGTFRLVFLPFQWCLYRDRSLRRTILFQGCRKETLDKPSWRDMNSWVSRKTKKLQYQLGDSGNKSSIIKFIRSWKLYFPYPNKCELVSRIHIFHHLSGLGGQYLFYYLTLF